MRAIVFSRDRPAQLDLLLHSIKLNAPEMFKQIGVIYHTTVPSFQQGYDRVQELHPTARLIQQHSFKYDVRMCLEGWHNCVAFLTDDDLFYRPFKYGPSPQDALAKDPDLLTVSLRLGLNTLNCYPLRTEQLFPSGVEVSIDLLKYIWRSGMWDFGYPASLDGNVWRSETIQNMISGQEYTNPNELEDVLVRGTKKARQKLMGCYRLSTIVNIPANRVNTTHRNRYGEQFLADPEWLNDRFLEGKRLSLGQMDLTKIDAAHCERELIFD